MGWVGLGRDFSVFGGLGWGGSTVAKVLKFLKELSMGWVDPWVGLG